MCLYLLNKQFRTSILRFSLIRQAKTRRIGPCFGSAISRDLHSPNFQDTVPTTVTTTHFLHQLTILLPPPQKSVVQPNSGNDPSKGPLKKNLKPTAGRTRKHFNNRNPEKGGRQAKGQSDGVAVMVGGERGLKVGDISSDLVGVPWV